MNTKTTHNNIPPFIKFSATEPISQDDIVDSPFTILFLKNPFTLMVWAHKKEITKSAKNVGSIIFPKYKNTNDDAKEK